MTKIYQYFRLLPFILISICINQSEIVWCSTLYIILPVLVSLLTLSIARYSVAERIRLFFLDPTAKTYFCYWNLFVWNKSATFPDGFDCKTPSVEQGPNKWFLLSKKAHRWSGGCTQRTLGRQQLRSNRENRRPGLDYPSFLRGCKLNRVHLWLVSRPLSFSFPLPLSWISERLDKVWFCGTEQDGIDHQAENAISYISVCLILLASSTSNTSNVSSTTPSTSVSNVEMNFAEVVRLLDRLVVNQKHLVNTLMENDVRYPYNLVSVWL